eukprot:13886385-Alexandrium_andersonii.AAC.1
MGHPANLTPERPDAQKSLYKTLAFFHGCPRGRLAEVVVNSELVKRSCSWSCHHCYMGRSEETLRAELAK